MAVARTIGMVVLTAGLLGVGCERSPQPPVPATQPAAESAAAPLAAESAAPPLTAGLTACELPPDMPAVEVPADRAAAEDLAALANARGSVLMIAHRLPEALREFRRIQRLLPDRLEGAVNEAIAYAHGQSEGCLAIARAKFESVLEKYPRQPHALYNLAVLVSQGSDPGRFAAALRHAWRFVEIVPDDPYGWHLVGQMLEGLDRKQEALANFKRSIEVDAEFVPGHQAYGSLLRMLRRGDQAAVEEAVGHLKTVARLNKMHKSVRFKSEGYTERGRYAQVMPLFGLGSTGQVAASDVAVSFEDVTDQAGLALSPEPLDGAAGLAWLDADEDGDLDLLVCGGSAGGQPRPTRLYRNGSARPPGDKEPTPVFADAAAEAGLQSLAGVTAAVSADWDRDDRPDVFLTGPRGSYLLAGDGASFRLQGGTSDAPLPATAGQPSLEDLDHDGDEDLYLAGLVVPTASGSHNVVYRNLSMHQESEKRGAEGADRKPVASRFVEGPPEWAIGADLRGVVGVLWADIDRDVDTDAIVFGEFEPGIAVFENRREGGFAAAQDALGPWKGGHVRGATLGDVDNNGRLDVIVTRGLPPVIEILLNKDGRFVPDAELAGLLPPNWHSAWGVAAVDADNDGDLDIAALVCGPDESEPRLVLLTNDGLGRWHFDASAASWPLPAAGRVIAPADADLDGWIDLAVRTADGQVRLLRNATANPRFTGREFRLRRSAQSHSDPRWKFSCPVGATVQVRTGRYAQLRRSATATGYYAQGSPWVHVGQGDRGAAGEPGAIDAVEILWSSGAIQGITDLPPSPPVLVDVAEVDVRVASCPFLYVWDGRQYQFLGDVVAASPPGLYLAPGVYAGCDPDEYIRIPDGVLKPRDGFFDLIIHECLREVAYLDQVQLIAVDHDESLAVYPNERFSGPPPFPVNKLFALEALHPPAQAVDHRGVDCRAELAVPDDGTSVREFRHLDIPGFGEPHAIEMQFDDVPPDRELVLLLHGYLKFPGSPSHYVAAERGLRFQMPRLELQRPDGRWETIIENTGAPAGFPRTMTVELTGRLTPGANRLRISTNILVYWDWARLGVVRPGAALGVTRLEADSAELSSTGFPRFVAPRRLGEPEVYDFGRMSALDQPLGERFTYRWPNMIGYYTRFGDVTELMRAADDRCAIFGPGEQVRLRFNADRLPPLARGAKRTFLVLVDGWVKDNYHQTATSATVEPLPFHAMRGYPPAEGDEFPWDEARRAWDQRYNTRAILEPGAL